MNSNFLKRGILITVVLISNWCCLLYYDSMKNRNDVIFITFVVFIPLISGLFLFKIFSLKRRKYYYSKNILIFFIYLILYFLMFRFFGKSTYYYELYTIMFYAIPILLIGILTFYKEKRHAL
jgi:hypothetical protein